MDDEYHQKLEDNKRNAEEKTAKKRAKRQKKKQRAKEQGKKKIKAENLSTSSSESEECYSKKEEILETQNLDGKLLTEDLEKKSSTKFKSLDFMNLDNVQGKNITTMEENDKK